MDNRYNNRFCFLNSRPTYQRYLPNCHSCVNTYQATENEMKYETDVTVVRGDIGPQGEPGCQGAKGCKGDTGAMGSVGSPGPRGQMGDIGPVGPRGEQGPVGPQGERGYVGPQGETGSQGAQGAAGPQGAMGIAGCCGAIGPMGPEGSQGHSGIFAFSSFAEMGLTLKDKDYLPLVNQISDKSYNITQTTEHAILLQPGYYLVYYYVSAQLESLGYAKVIPIYNDSPQTCYQGYANTNHANEITVISRSFIIYVPVAKPLLFVFCCSQVVFDANININIEKLCD